MKKLICAAAFLAAACSSPAAAPTQPSAAPAATAACTPAPGQHGARPGWANGAPSTVPYSVSTPDNAAAFFFSTQLRAGKPENPFNKILWVMRTPRNGSPLEIDARPGGAAQPVLHFSQPANSGPGEIYPTIVDGMTVGCWRFDLRWGKSTARIDLEVKA